MKKTFQVTLLFCAMIMASTVPMLGQVNVPGDYGSINAAIAGVSPGTTINLVNSSYSENVVVNKAVTIKGLGLGLTTISGSSGIGIVVTTGGVTIQDLTVSGFGAQGIYAHDFTGTLMITNVAATGNGTVSTSSGVSLVNVSSTPGNIVLSGVHATGNTRHGLEIGNGCANVDVEGGDFSSNGSGTSTSFGGGIMIYADASQSVSGVIINGALTANTNTIAGIYLFCDSTGTIANTTIGASGTVTLNDNGNSTSGGAAVVVYGPCSNTTITASSTKSVGFDVAGLVVVGTNGLGDHSPTNTTVKNSTLTGYSTTSPAGTMWLKNGSDSLLCNQNVDATLGNLIDNATTGFQVEDMLRHKLDDARLGLFLAPLNTVYVTPNSGSIQRGIDAAGGVYDTVKVEAGTYAENVNVNKAIVLSGEGAGTKIKPASGAPVSTTVSGVTVDSLHLYLDAAFAPANSPTFTNNTFTFLVQAKVFLQGPYSAGSMRTTLPGVSGFPLSQPYNVAPFNYGGTESVVSVPSGVVDWILVELRSGTAGSTKTAERACFLKGDGTVLDTDGSTGVVETDTIASGYDLTGYMVIKHRNHLAVMSAASVAMPNGSAYDFTSDSTSAYGFTSSALWNLTDLPTGSGGIYAMRSGNADGSTTVNAVDRNNYWKVQNGTSGYLSADFDFTGTVNAIDRNLHWLKNNGKGSLVPN